MYRTLCVGRDRNWALEGAKKHYESPPPTAHPHRTVPTMMTTPSLIVFFFPSLFYQIPPKTGSIADQRRRRLARSLAVAGSIRQALSSGRMALSISTRASLSRRGLRYAAARLSSSSAANSTSSDGETLSTGDGEFTTAEIDECNGRYRGILQICDTEGKGRGLLASRQFGRNDLIMSAKAIGVSDVRCSHSVQTGWDEHVVMDLPAILINHSCDANVGIQDNELGAYDFFAIKNIIKGEELVWDYNASEWEISTPFQCACGSARCQRLLRGFKHDGDHIRQAYGPFYASYLKRTGQ